MLKHLRNRIRSGKSVFSGLPMRTRLRKEGGGCRWGILEAGYPPDDELSRSP
jgi:hypothetical protein